MKKSFSKKSLAFLLAIAVVLTSLATSFAVTASANETNLDIWDGTIADAYAGGTGTQADPYLISTPEQLARMIGYDVLTNYSGNVANGSVDKYYKLTTDIYLNDVSKAKWYEGSGINHWFNAGSSRFCGYFDGAGYTVYGLAFADGATYAALIPFIDSWSADRYVKNVTVSHSYIKGSYAAGITARVTGNNGKTVFYENCYVDDTVIIEATSKAKDPYAGGFVAFTNAGNKTVYDFKNCASLATNPDGTALKYGFVGYNATSYYELFYTINNCFAYANTWQGLTSKGTVVNSYLVSDLATITGEAAKTAMPDLTWDSVWYTTENGYPTLTAPAAPEEPECEHENTKDAIIEEATYFKAGLKNIVCADDACGAMVETDVVVPASDVALNGDFTETFADGKLTISWTYSDALALDIANGAVITFNYEIAGYENAVELTGETGETVILEGFNADRLNAELTYNLSAVYGDVDTAKLNAVGGTVKAADIANDEKLDALLEALEADAVVDGKAENTQWLVSNIAKLDLKAAKAELNVAASQELIDALAAKGGRTDRAVKLIVKIGDNFTKEFEINDLRKYTIVTISGLSFEQLNGDISVQLVFDYANDEYDFATDEIVFACGDMIANANTTAADAFVAYMN